MTKKIKKEKKAKGSAKYRFVKNTGDQRKEIAKDIIDYARNQKTCVKLALGRIQRTGKFEDQLTSYMKTQKIGRTEAWNRISTTCLKAMKPKKAR
jgi:hypothetical protein